MKPLPEDTRNVMILAAEKTKSQKTQRDMIVLELEFKDNGEVPNIENEPTVIDGTKFRSWAMADREGRDYSTGLDAWLRGVEMEPLGPDGDLDAFDAERLVGLEAKILVNSEVQERKNRVTGETIANPHTGEVDTFLRWNVSKVWNH